jgi:hypothetical protein
MKRLYKTVFVSVIFSLFVFSLNGCEMNFLSSQPQIISEAVEVGTDWKEIVPPTPLRSKTLVHNVKLIMPDSIWREATWDESDPKRQTLKYGDGKRGKIEAILYDDKGDAYELQINGKGGGFDLGRPVKPRNPNEPPRNEPDFPADRNFTKLRIRSEVPLKLDKIEWTGYNPK